MLKGLWVCFSFRETCLARWETDPDLSLLLHPCRNYILFGLFLAKCKQNAMIPKPWYTKDMIFSPSFASSDTNFNISVLLYWYSNFFATSKQNCSDSESHGILNFNGKSKLHVHIFWLLYTFLYRKTMFGRIGQGQTIVADAKILIW